MIRCKTAITALLLMSLSSFAFAQEKPNIVLVFMDNFGWGEPGFNGGPDRKSPSGTEWIEKSVLQLELPVMRGSRVFDGVGVSLFLSSSNTSRDSPELPHATDTRATIAKAGSKRCLLNCIVYSG